MVEQCPHVDLHRAILDEDRPGWTRETVWCPPCRGEHIVEREPGQVPMLAAEAEGEVAKRAGGYGGRLLEDGRTMCFHGNTSAAVYGACAYCASGLHVHQDALGGVKSGRALAGYLVEKCPACHRANAVHAAYGLGGIRTARIDSGAPVMEMKLVR